MPRAKKTTEAAPKIDAETPALLDEAMAELAAKDARITELEKIAGQLGSLDDLKHLLWEARTIRLLIDPEAGESLYAALARRKNENPESIARSLTDLEKSRELPSVEELMTPDEEELERNRQRRAERIVEEQSLDDEVIEETRRDLETLDELGTKAEAFDKMEEGLDKVVADAFDATVSSPDVPLHGVWEKIPPLERRRVVKKMQEHVRDGVAEVMAG